MLIFSPHNSNLCLESQETRFLWNIFEAVQKIRSTCFIGIKTLGYASCFYTPIKHCCSFFKHNVTPKPEEGWSGHPKYCFKYITLCQPCSSLWLLKVFIFQIWLIRSPLRSNVQSSRIFVHGVCSLSSLVYHFFDVTKREGCIDPRKNHTYLAAKWRGVHLYSLVPMLTSAPCSNRMVTVLCKLYRAATWINANPCLSVLSISCFFMLLSSSSTNSNLSSRIASNSFRVWADSGVVISLVSWE